MPPRENSSSIGHARVADEAGRHGGEVGLNGGRDRPELRLIDEGGDRCPLGEGSQDPGQQRRPEDGQERRVLQDGGHDEEREREQVEGRDVECRAERVLGRLGADGALRLGVQPEEEEEHEADPERRAGRPDHVPDVLPGGEAAADQLRDQDGGLRQGGHLVAEVRAADHRPGGDRLLQAQHLGHADEGDAEGARGGPGAAGDHAHQGADRCGGDVEPARAHQPDPVGHHRRDRAGHVPGADQRPHGEQDEDRPHGRGDAPDRRVTNGGDGVAVLERDQAGERGAEEQGHLQRPVGRVDPEECDREGEQADQDNDGKERVEQAGWAWRPAARPWSGVGLGAQRWLRGTCHAATSCPGDHCRESAVAERPDLLGAAAMIGAPRERHQPDEDQGQHGQ